MLASVQGKTAFVCPVTTVWPRELRFSLRRKMFGVRQICLLPTVHFTSLISLIHLREAQITNQERNQDFRNGRHNKNKNFGPPIGRSNLLGKLLDFLTEKFFIAFHRNIAKTTRIS